MTLLYDNVLSLSDSHDKCIILCDENTVQESRTFQEVNYLCKVIRDQISKYLLKTTECVGLFMDHNIYLPAIIIRYPTMHFTKNILQ